MNEDVNSVSPTLGFIIKTIDYEGQVVVLIKHASCTDKICRYKLNICEPDHRLRANILTLHKGMLAAKRHFDPIGETILRKLMP
jgi:hypothetical protein